MAPKITEHNIDKMLELYRQCDKELEEIMKTMDAQYARASLSYVHNCWIKRQRTKILQRFQRVEARRNQLRSDIHFYYMDELERKSDEKCRAISASKSTESEKRKCPKSAAWTNSGETSLPCKRSTFNGKKLPKFTRILGVMKKRFSGEN